MDAISKFGLTAIPFWKNGALSWKLPSTTFIKYRIPHNVYYFAMRNLLYRIRSPRLSTPFDCRHSLYLSLQFQPDISFPLFRVRSFMHKSHSWLLNNKYFIVLQRAFHSPSVATLIALLHFVKYTMELCPQYEKKSEINTSLNPSTIATYILLHPRTRPNYHLHPSILMKRSFMLIAEERKVWFLSL